MAANEKGIAVLKKHVESILYPVYEEYKDNSSEILKKILRIEEASSSEEENSSSEELDFSRNEKDSSSEEKDSSSEDIIEIY